LVELLHGSVWNLAWLKTMLIKKHGDT